MPSTPKPSVRINEEAGQDLTVDERAPLISGGEVERRDFGVFAHHDQPTFAHSMRSLFFCSRLNILLLAVPLSFVSHFAGWGATADFVISFIAIIPLAGLLGVATEQCALKVGQTVGGLLNATFGNAVELIVAIVALTRGQLRIVQSSMLGSILSNLLLVLGCAFIGAGIKFKESTFQATAAQASASLMTLACVGLVIPAAYHSSQMQRSKDLADNILGDMGDEAAHGLLVISRGTAIILFLMYILYLVFQLGTHVYLFENEEGDEEEEEVRMNLIAAMSALTVVTVVTAFCADYLVDSIDEFALDRGIPKAFIGLILLPIVGNAAEHVTSVWMASKGKMELAIGVAVGSSIQIAVGVIPVLVLIGWIIGQELTLFFEDFETVIIVFSVLLVTLLIQDGKSNYMEGAMLCALYVIIALAFWVS